MQRKSVNLIFRNQCPKCYCNDRLSSTKFHTLESVKITYDSSSSDEGTYLATVTHVDIVTLLQIYVLYVEKQLKFKLLFATLLDREQNKRMNLVYNMRFHVMEVIGT